MRFLAFLWTSISMSHLLLLRVILNLTAYSRTCVKTFFEATFYDSCAWYKIDWGIIFFSLLSPFPPCIYSSVWNHCEPYSLFFFGSSTKVIPSLIASLLPILEFEWLFELLKWLWLAWGSCMYGVLEELYRCLQKFRKIRKIRKISIDKKKIGKSEKKKKLRKFCVE